jgi:hypothetical protein
MYNCIYCTMLCVSDCRYSDASVGGEPLALSEGYLQAFGPVQRVPATSPASWAFGLQCFRLPKRNVCQN